jgi:hypothetical protein
MKFSAILAIVGVTAAFPGRSSSSVTRRTDLGLKSSKPNMRDEINTLESGNWGGWVHDSTGVSHVEATIVIPTATGGASKGAAIWVGIDGDTCNTSLLQTGVTVYGDGTASAWVEWIPADSETIDFEVNAGDTLYMAVTASSPTTGTATLENHSTGKTYSAEVPNPYNSRLCQFDAEWIVEDFTDINTETGQESPAPFADYGTVTFTGCSATGSDGTYSLSGGESITMINADGQESVCGSSGTSLTCRYEA